MVRIRDFPNRFISSIKIIFKKKADQVFMIKSVRNSPIGTFNPGITSVIINFKTKHFSV
jgi:hypothetical protein